jgi:hypothetical protein
MGSRIERVTVFREGARVVRAMVIDGDAVLARFDDLPLALDDASIRASVAAGEGVALDVHVGLDVPAEDPARADAEDAVLEGARLAAEKARAEVARLGHAHARLDLLKVVARPAPRENEPPLPIPLESRQRLLALRTSEEERIGKALAQAKVVARDAERKLTEETERVRRDTNARNARSHELRKVAIVSLASAKKGATVTLEYAVPGARWSPSYVLTLAGSDRARLGMRALVAQRTGEDWTGVKLSLSTAMPDAWTELPELAKSRIGRAQPRRSKSGYREPPEGAAALYADYDRAAPPPPPPTPHAPLGGAGEDTLRAVPKSETIAAPPFPQQAPAPAAAPAPMMMQSAPRGAAVGAAFGAPKRALSRARAARAEPPAELAEVAAEELERGGAPEIAQARAPDWETAAESLAYGRLRMAAPSDAGRVRGELYAIASASAYVEALGVRVRVDVSAAIAVALGRATIDEASLPKGHELARTHDAYDYLYAAELPCDVAADGSFRAVPIADRDAKTIVRHVAVPREAQQVYRMLEIESPLDAALLAGPLDVYEAVEGGETTYKTTTRMPETPPRGRVEIGLGVEPAIKIARVTTFQEESAGLLGGSLALVHKLNVELRNLMPRAVTVEVRERVPVVRKDDADVKIEVGAIEPAWEAWDQEQSLRGGHLWKVVLDPGATKSLSVRYTIKIASKLELVGGNRRES